MFNNFFKSTCLLAGLFLFFFSWHQSLAADWDDFDWDDSYTNDDSGDDEEESAGGSTSILDFLDENRTIKLRAEEFIYPFSAEHKPMLSSNLVASVQGIAQGFESVRVQTANAASGKKGKVLVSRKVGIKPGLSLNGGLPLNGNSGIPLDGLPIGPAGAVQIGSIDGKIPKAGEGKGDKEKSKVVLPPFEITGTFSRRIGSDVEQYIVVGNRYYTIEDKLKGSRNLRKVTLIGIDEQFAYFTYQDVSFVKKIKALESVF